MSSGTVDRRRVTAQKSGTPGAGTVVYAMARDQRVRDNWALCYALELAREASQPLVVAAMTVADYPSASSRQRDFLLSGLQEVEQDLTRLNISFSIITEDFADNLVLLLDRLKAGVLVADFSPLRAGRHWRNQIRDNTSVPFFEVDSHNIVPARLVSDKCEFAARTLRPKINRQLGEFLTEFPRLREHPHPLKHKLPKVNWRKIERSLAVDDGVAPVTHTEPGTKAGMKRLRQFLRWKLPHYHDRRNDPNADAQSLLSPYLHFGQISAQRVAFETMKHDSHIPSQEAFLEELIVRRELSDNFCLHNERYDSIEGFPDWARTTLNEHRNDHREYIYDRPTFEQGQTHDPLWNAAQADLRANGRMPGYLRMYWAKKILHWSATPEDALATAIYLNDRYQLDGNDPNGYAGVAWSIGGVHDRPWFEREIFGKIRLMTASGCRRKFDADRYVRSVAMPVAKDDI